MFTNNEKQMSNNKEKEMSNNIVLARQCLALIAETAARCSSSADPELLGYALQQLSQVLYERTGNDHTIFEVIPADKIGGLQKLYRELDFVNCGSQDMFTRVARENPSAFIEEFFERGTIRVITWRVAAHSPAFGEVVAC
jgi:hypothetical protein